MGYRRWALGAVLTGVLAISHQPSAISHVATLDPYGCHANKARYGTSQTRECHQDLLAGHEGATAFPSLQAELKAYIAALRAEYSALSTQHSALKGELFVIKGELELAKLKLSGLADATIYSCAIARFASSTKAGP